MIEVVGGGVMGLYFIMAVTGFMALPMVIEGGYSMRRAGKILAFSMLGVATLLTILIMFQVLVVI